MILKYLMSKGADVNAKDNDDETPLHSAAYWGHVACIGWLLANGARLDAVNKYQWTALDVAQRKNNEEATQLLLDETRFAHAMGKPGHSDRS